MDLNKLTEMLDIIASRPRIKSISVTQDDAGIINIELFPATPQVQAYDIGKVVGKGLTDMPPDDVMLFAATEDVDELIKQRKE